MAKRASGNPDLELIEKLVQGSIGIFGNGRTNRIRMLLPLGLFIASCCRGDFADFTSLLLDAANPRIRDLEFLSHFVSTLARVTFPKHISMKFLGKGFHDDLLR